VRRVIERDIDTLRAVLENPATLTVVAVVAAEKLDDAGIGHARALQQPVTAAIQRQPAEY